MMKFIVYIGLSGFLLFAASGFGVQNSGDPDPNNPGGSQANGGSMGSVSSKHAKKKSAKYKDQESASSAAQESTARKNGHTDRKSKAADSETKK